MRRRGLLVALGGLAAAACVPPPPPRDSTPSAPGSAIGTWDAQARDLLAAALGPLATFDTFAAHRASTAPRSTQRTARELPWDPPTPAAWSAALAEVPRLQQRAEEVYGAVARSTPDPSLWRERRALAAAALSLAEMSRAMAAYRAAAEALDPDSDGSQALGLLSQAWNRWESGAAYWGVDRAETLACA